MSSAADPPDLPQGTNEEPHPPDLSVVPIIGIGGSAGGIAAVSSFLSQTPADCGVAIVVIVHLSPTHDSALAALFQRVTGLKVMQAETGQKVEANCVYVIPPAKHLVAVDGHLKLTDLPPIRGRLVAIDTFFRTLADTHGSRAVAVLVSGADADGSIGIKRIKERGGLAIAQDPSQSQHPEMPRSAIATGLVDWVLAVENMPRSILKYLAADKQIRPPPEAGPHPAHPLPAVEDAGENALRAVLDHLRLQTGRDFSAYKRATIIRRVTRRAQVNGVTEFSDYLQFLRTHPEEVGALSQDLLISVTNFFRDADAFLELERQIPRLFRRKDAAQSVRVWVAGCATGEEAYSIAMLLCEHARLLESAPRIQIFATDLSEDAVNHARMGQYPDTIVADVSAERLERFFVPDGSGYRIRKELRDLVLFAQHDLLKDAPFSKLDLISCRNLLIYLARSAQLQVFETFHFVLKPEGLLLLGSSESLSDGSLPFEAVDKKHRLYASTRSLRPGLSNWANPSPLGVPTPVSSPAASPSRTARGLPSSLSRGRPWADVYFKLLDQTGPASVLINREQEILYLSGSAGRYFRFAEGEPSKHVLATVHSLLRPELRRLLFQADQTPVAIRSSATALDLDGKTEVVTVQVLPADAASGFRLIMFEKAAGPRPESAIAVPPPDDSIAQQLEQELKLTRNESREAIEQYEASSEELRASNEELQSMNEEMRAATEELETGREELQSTNEELAMVNLELKSKVDELAQTNGDLHNLMSATKIAIVFLDNELRITRYTPSALSLFSLIPTDLGRPLADLSHRIAYPRLDADARKVLADLTPIESEVSDNQGKWYLARVLPYRTMEDRIAGVVLTFVEITAHKANQATLRAGEDQLRAALGQVLMAQETERSRISKGLHDVVGQEVTALLLGLNALEQAGGAVPASARELRRRTELIGEEIHELALELRPTSLDEFGLIEALQHYLTNWSKRTGVAVDIHSAGLEKTRFPAVYEMTLYRIIREALNNIAKHAQANRVSLVVEKRANQAVAIIEDDGQGFDPTKPSSDRKRETLGLSGMKERAMIAGGTIEIESARGRGTTIYVRIPLGQAELASDA